jgi:hypothetical protein
MALPEDMQFVPVILNKDDVRRIDELVQQQKRAGDRRASRSKLLRSVIVTGLDAFFSPDGSVNRTNLATVEHNAA